MPSLVKPKTQHPVCAFQEGSKDDVICTGARMRLDVCVLSTERLLGPAGRKILSVINDFAAAMVSLAGETFGGLILQD